MDPWSRQDNLRHERHRCTAPTQEVQREGWRSPFGKGCRRSSIVFQTQDAMLMMMMMMMMMRVHARSQSQQDTNMRSGFPQCNMVTALLSANSKSDPFAVDQVFRQPVERDRRRCRLVNCPFQSQRAIQPRNGSTRFKPCTPSLEDGLRTRILRNHSKATAIIRV